MSKWTTTEIGDQSARRVIVTGANSGIGLVTARELARRGARVTLAVRDTAKGDRAAASMPGDVAVRRLDLADLASVREFADATTDPVDLLVNNAGVMAIPRRETADGFEMQLGTNHLGHFGLTGMLLDRILASAAGRVVTVSSTAHKLGRMRWDDLQGARRYQRWEVYAQSKLANLLFAFELQRRADAAGSGLLSLAAHPGYAATELQIRGAAMDGSALKQRATRLMTAALAQSAEMGALPTLLAATAPDLPGGSFIGPDGPGEMRGHPRLVDATARAKDPEAARRLWTVSEALTGVTYPFGAVSAAA